MRKDNGPGIALVPFADFALYQLALVPLDASRAMVHIVDTLNVRVRAYIALITLLSSFCTLVGREFSLWAMV
jgi:hypothetical protein